MQWSVFNIIISYKYTKINVFDVPIQFYKLIYLGSSKYKRPG